MQAQVDVRMHVYNIADSISYSPHNKTGNCSACERVQHEGANVSEEMLLK